MSLSVFSIFNQPSSLSLSPSTMCAVPLIILVALCWMQSSLSVSVLSSGVQSSAWYLERVSEVLSRGGGKRFPWLAGHTPANAAQDAAHIQLVAYQHSLFYRAVFHPVVPWPVLIPRIIPSQMQGFAPVPDPNTQTKLI